MGTSCEWVVAGDTTTVSERVKAMAHAWGIPIATPEWVIQSIIKQAVLPARGKEYVLHARR